MQIVPYEVSAQFKFLKYNPPLIFDKEGASITVRVNWFSAYIIKSYLEASKEGVSRISEYRRGACKYSWFEMSGTS